MSLQTNDELRKEFISKFTRWDSKFRYATLTGIEEYPTPDMIADYWLSHRTADLKAQLEDVLRIIIEETSSHVTREYRDTDSMRDLLTSRIAELDNQNK